MAYSRGSARRSRSRSSYGGRGSARRTSVSRRSYSGRSTRKRAVARPQTLRIVLEQPAMQPVAAVPVQSVEKPTRRSQF